MRHSTYSNAHIKLLTNFQINVVCRTDASTHTHSDTYEHTECDRQQQAHNKCNGLVCARHRLDLACPAYSCSMTLLRFSEFRRAASARARARASDVGRHTSAATGRCALCGAALHMGEVYQTCAASRCNMSHSCCVCVVLVVVLVSWEMRRTRVCDRISS